MRGYKLANAPTYHAVSYTWGSAAQTTTVLINRREMPVRENIYHFLLQANWPADRRDQTLLWIDEICIDQSNTLEKNEQVQMMGKIYGSCSSVFICMACRKAQAQNLLLQDEDSWEADL